MSIIDRIEATRLSIRLLTLEECRRVLRRRVGGLDVIEWDKANLAFLRSEEDLSIVRTTIGGADTQAEIQGGWLYAELEHLYSEWREIGIVSRVYRS